MPKARSAAPWCAISAAMAWGGFSMPCPTSCIMASRDMASTLKPGMFFTVEPMINLGDYGVKVLNDGWTAVTRDRSLSAQFEHSVGVTENGVEIFTLSPKGLGQASLSLRRSRMRRRIRAVRSRSCHRSQCRPSRTLARALPQRRRGGDARLRIAGAGAVRRHAAPRHQAVGQGADRAVRQLRRSDRGAARTAAGNSPASGEAVVTQLKIVEAAAAAPGPDAG